MNTPETMIASDDALFDLQCKIARRADDLARLSQPDPKNTLECWLQAEREVWQDAPLPSASRA